MPSLPEWPPVGNLGKRNRPCAQSRLDELEGVGYVRPKGEPVTIYRVTHPGYQAA